MRIRREPSYTFCGNETVEKTALKAIKHLFPPPPLAGGGILRSFAGAGFWIEFEIRGPRFYGSRVSNVEVSRPVPAYRQKTLRSQDESSERALSVYTAGRDTGCGRPFNSVFDLDYARKSMKEGCKRARRSLFRFIGSAPRWWSLESNRVILIAPRFEAIFFQLVADVSRKIPKFSCYY